MSFLFFGPLCFFLHAYILCLLPRSCSGSRRLREREWGDTAAPWRRACCSSSSPSAKHC
jgi:hypothetical protein